MVLRGYASRQPERCLGRYDASCFYGQVGLVDERARSNHRAGGTDYGVVDHASGGARCKTISPVR